MVSPSVDEGDPVDTQEIQPIEEVWKNGIKPEVQFWRGVIFGSEKRPTWQQNFLERCNPEKPFEKKLAGFFTRPLREARVLDVGAGPVSVLGWVHNGIKINITAVDPLADQYNALLDEAKIVPPVRTTACDGEKLTDIFPQNSFDVVHMRNALDHSYDPVRVISQAMAVARPGGSFVIRTHVNEAVHEEYAGFHQWNICLENEHLVVWRPGAKTVVAQAVPEISGVEILSSSEATENTRGWLRVRLIKG